MDTKEKEANMTASYQTRYNDSRMCARACSHAHYALTKLGGAPGCYNARGNTAYDLIPSKHVSAEIMVGV